MGSPARWYERFLANLSVPLEDNADRVQVGETVPYAFRVASAEFRELHAAATFSVHVFFYDTKSRQFFGRQWNGRQRRPSNHYLTFDETLFFHTSVAEDRIVLVCEIVKLDNEPWVYAWSVVPVFVQSQAITDYSTSSVPPPLKRFQLYRGSCKNLLYLNSLSEMEQKLTKSDGVLVCCLQTHQRMNAVVEFFPEFYLASREEHIPGIRRAPEGDSYLTSPQPADTFTAVIDNIAISFGASPNQVEESVLSLLNREYCYRLNKSPKDLNVPKLAIIERRLRVGVHNSLTYVEEPICLYLSSKEESSSGRQSFRHRSRSLSRASSARSTGVKATELADFIARNSVKLTRLCADPTLAIVFAMDYLVGVRKTEEITAESELVTVCWNAWSPYHDGSFSVADTVTVPLVGGPRPNPDGVLCFKNLLRIHGDANPLADGRPHMNLKFNFAIVGATDSQALLHIPRGVRTSTALASGRHTTPLPRPDVTVHELEDPPREEPRLAVERPLVRTPVDEEESLLSPMAPSDRSRMQKAVSMPSIPRESEADLQQPYEPYTARVSSLPRGVAVYLSRQDFPLIRDRNGEVPRAVDPFAKRAINTELELGDRLDTNEVVLQFLAFMPLNNAYTTTNTRGSHYFFTFQFYRFREVTTERLLAHSGREWRPTEPAVLKRIDENNRLIDDDGNGFMVKFTVDKSSMSPTDQDDFVQYLAWNILYIDVWNADSLIHLGTAAVPLKFLCRQGHEAVQATLQCPVVQNSLPDDPVTTSLLYLRMASIGHPSNSQIDLYESTNTAAVVSQRLVRLGADTKSKFRLRARPLSAIHDSALQRFLNIQKLDIHQRKDEVFSNQNIYRIQQWNEMKKGSTEQPPVPTKATLKRFIFQEELEAYKTLRNESKASKLLKAVFRGITANHIIRAKFGQVEFFEYVLQNTFAEPVNCAIDITDSRLSLVKNADEWKFFKAANHVKSPLERDLFYVDEDGDTTIRLNSMESVFVPFKYDAFATSEQATNGDNFEIKAIFKRTDTGEPISILELLVHNRNFTVTNSYRWFHEESTRLSKLLRISGVKDNQRILGLRVTDPTVLCSLRNTPNAGQELLLTCYSGESPSTKSFVIFLYADTHHHRLLAAWKIIVHAVQRLNVEGIQGQTTKIPLYLRRTGQEEMVQFFSSSEAISFLPSQPIMTASQALTDAKALLVPNFTGSRAAIVTAVDATSRHMLNIWMLHIAVREPNIVKTYAIEIPLGETKTVQKRLSFENQYSIPRKFRLHTSNEQLVTVQHEYYEVAPREVVTILLNFQPVRLNQPTTVQAILFVENAETAQQEEAYALKISYTG